MDLGGLAIAGGAFLIVTLHHSLTSNDVSRAPEIEIAADTSEFEQFSKSWKDKGIEIARQDGLILLDLSKYLRETTNLPQFSSCEQLFDRLQSAGILELRHIDGLAPGQYNIDVAFTKDGIASIGDIAMKVKTVLADLPSTQNDVLVDATETKDIGKGDDSIKIPENSSRRKSSSHRIRQELRNEVADAEKFGDDTQGHELATKTDARTPRARKSISANPRSTAKKTRKLLDEEGNDVTANTAAGHKRSKLDG